MNDLAQTGLKTPAPVDWDKYGNTGSYQAPPDAFDDKGNFIVYYGVTSPTLDEPFDGHLQYKLDPITLVKGSADGYVIRFTRVNLKPWELNGVPKKGNPSSLGDYLKACALQAKPQQISEYQAAIRMTANKPFPFVGDWEAYNKDNQESIKGFFNFPIDPSTGKRKAILHAGDVLALTDKKGVPNGQVYTVKSEVIFANFRLRYFRDPSKGVK